MLSDGSVDAEGHRLRFARQISNTQRPRLAFDPHVGNICDVTHGLAPRNEVNFDDRGLGRQRLSSHKKSRALSEIERPGCGLSGMPATCFPTFHPVPAK